VRVPLVEGGTIRVERRRDKGRPDRGTRDSCEQYRR
jgi:hypothetical protein